MLGKYKEINSFIDDLLHNHDKQECHTIVFLGNLWYNCDKQEYHTFALYMGSYLFIGSLWHKYNQYKGQSIAWRVRYFQL